jgi:ferrochelatase
MAAGSPYVEDLMASCHGVAEILGVKDWQLAYQSRSGDPRARWLDPDIRQVLRDRAAKGVTEIVVQAIGFLCDHVEVLYDLDVEAARLCAELKVTLRRAPCVNSHPAFIAMLGEQVLKAAGAVS